jgi:hypothetical protein
MPSQPPRTGIEFRPNPSLQAMQAKVAQARMARPPAFQPNPALAAMQAKMGQSPSQRPGSIAQPTRTPPGLPRVAFSPNPALRAAQAKMTQLRGHAGCRCSTCTCGARTAAASTAPAIHTRTVQPKMRNGVIQRSSESDYDQQSSQSSDSVSEDAGCEEDNCIDSDCNVKDTHHGDGRAKSLSATVRARFYGAFDSTTSGWKAVRLIKLKKKCTGQNFQCEHCRKCVPLSTLSIDHLTPVATHWNTIGYDSDQNTRNVWYNKTSNLALVSKNHNSSMGSGGVKYRRDVGPNFTGPPGC